MCLLIGTIKARILPVFLHVYVAINGSSSNFDIIKGTNRILGTVYFKARSVVFRAVLKNSRNKS